MNTFVQDYLRQFDRELLKDPMGRIALTKYRPLLFALLYLPHHLTSKETDEITLSEFHLDVYDYATSWCRRERVLRKNRSAWISPRASGKTTNFFLILPLWAAAHKHKKFITSFANAATQAEEHLSTFRLELASNVLLQYDFPELCTPMRIPGKGAVADRAEQFRSASGFTLVAKGMDSSSLGLKVGELRPDLLILDDIEPEESQYSPTIRDKRLGTLVDGILPLNEYATVVLVGTTTMPGCITHALVKQAAGEEPEPWITEQNFVTNHFRAILTDENGEERSLWPEKWPLEYLRALRHTRDYAKNFDCDPMAGDSAYWSRDDFHYVETHPLIAAAQDTLTGMLLSIDPAVTTKEKSDYTGLAIVGYSAIHDVAVVQNAWQVKLAPGEPLRKLILRILNAHPTIAGIVIESNQGGEAWKPILHDVPVKVWTVFNTKPKEVRAAQLLLEHQRGPRVGYVKRIAVAEEQLVGFPKVRYDDVLDAIGTGVNQFLKPRKVLTDKVGSYI